VITAISTGRRMAERRDGLRRAASSSSDWPQPQPLVLDDGISSQDIETFAREDIQEDIERHQRTIVARTLFRQERGDDDTL